jgi:hypothetical protein
MSVARVALSHTFAAVVVIGGSALLATCVYAALLVWAIVFNQPLGGPLALPFMVLAAVAASGLSVICVLMPATLAGEWLRRRSHRAMPVVIVIVAIEAVSIATLAMLAWDVPARTASLSAITGGGALLALLGVYWLCVRSASWVLGERAS